MKSNRGLFKSLTLRPDLRVEARKIIGDRGGAECFQRRHNADGKMEYWLEIADIVKVRKEAGVQVSYGTPPPGWTLGDCPSQDPLCAKEFRLPEEENARIQRDLEDMVTNSKEELQKVGREMNKQFTKKMQEEILCFQVQSSAHLKSDFDCALVEVEKQLTDIPDSIMGMKEQIRTLSSMADLASKTTDCCAKKERNQAAGERCQEVAVVKKCVSTGETTAAVEKSAELQKPITGFGICKPQGTFLWPNMGANDGSSPVSVQVEDLFMVHTPPSISSSTASASPQLPTTTSTQQPLPSWCQRAKLLQSLLKLLSHIINKMPTMVAPLPPASTPQEAKGTTLSLTSDIPDT